MKAIIITLCLALLAQNAQAKRLSVNKVSCLRINAVSEEFESRAVKILQISRRDLVFVGAELNGVGNCVVVFDTEKYGEVGCTVHEIYADRDTVMADGERIDRCDR